MSKRLLAPVLVLTLIGLAFPEVHAQETGTISGVVTEAQSEGPLPGVQVVIPDLNTGTTTNAEGEYEFEAPTGEYQVEARFVGYQTAQRTVTVQAGESTLVNFTLRQASLDLEEVVVTGTGGPVEKRKLGNQVASIRTSRLEDAPIQDFSELLQGREPGVVGLPSQGQTGSGSRIRIRGLATLSQSNEPVVYIDGVRVDNGGGGPGDTGTSRLDDLNSEAIENVEILKGAAAATLYGSEASNGVIQIFTKSGSEGDTRYSFSTTQSAIQMPNLWGPNTGFARTEEQANRMNSVFDADVAPYEILERNFTDELYGLGHAQTYSGSVEGGSENINYYVNIRHQRENGPFEPTFDRRDYPSGISPIGDDELERTQATLTVTAFPLDQLRIRSSASYTNSDLQTYPAGNFITATTAVSRYSKLENATSNNVTGAPGFTRTVNETTQEIMKEGVNKFTGSLNLNYQPLESLTIDGTFGLDFTNSEVIDQLPFQWNIDNFGSGNVQGTRSVTDRGFLQWTGDLKGTLDTELGNQLESTLIFGAQAFSSDERTESISAVDFPGPGFGVTGAATSQQSVGESLLQERQLGIFVQEQLGFRDYAFVTLGGRFDANSAFGDEFDAAFYPKIQLSVVPTDADFWNVGEPLTSLRFRFAVGESGLQPGAFDAFTTFSSLASTNGPGVVPSNLGNPDLEPERSREFEFGTDVGLFSDRLGIDATYWTRTVRDALVQRQFAPSGGFTTPQLVNIGEIDAQGVEIGVEASALDLETVTADLFVNASYLWQQVQSLGGAPDIKAGSGYSRIRNFVQEGFAPGSHFGAELLNVPDGSMPVDLNGDGQPDTRQEVLDYLGGLTPQTASLPNSASQVLRAPSEGGPLGHYKGKPFPDWQGSFGGTITFFDNLTVSTQFEYKFGNYHVNNLTGAFRQQDGFIGRNIPVSTKLERDFITGGLESGTPQNDPGVRMEALETWINEMLGLAPFSGLNTIEKADFLRWRELSLSYDLPQSLVQSYGIDQASLTFAVRNLALFTSFSGTDPELNIKPRGTTGITADEDLNEGVEAYGIPTPRRFSLTFRLQF